MSEWRESQENRELAELVRFAKDILAELKHIRRAIDKEFEEPATSGTISQIEGGITMAAITGTKVGGSSVFQVVWNGAMTPGAAVTWSCPDDPGITFQPVPTDPTGNSVTVADAVADTLTKYTLNVSGTASDGTAVTATASVPLLTSPATGGTIGQLS